MRVLYVSELPGVPDVRFLHSLAAAPGVEAAFATFEYRTEPFRGVMGVEGVIVSGQHQSAMVLYDDTLTAVSDLVLAPKEYGFKTTVLSGAEASLRDPRGAPTNLESYE